MDFLLRVGLILALGAAAIFVLQKIDPMGGKDYSGVPPKAKRMIVIALAALVALWLLLADWGPLNFDECRAEAAKMPTSAGVQLAASNCAKRFKP